MFGQSQYPTARGDFLGRVEGYGLPYGVDASVRATYLSDQRSVRIDGRNRSVEFSSDGPRILLPRHPMKKSTVVRDPKKYAGLVLTNHAICVHALHSPSAVSFGRYTVFGQRTVLDGSGVLGTVSGMRRTRGLAHPG